MAIFMSGGMARRLLNSGSAEGMLKTSMICKPMPNEEVMSHMFSITHPRLIIPNTSPSEAGARFLASYSRISSAGQLGIKPCRGIGSLACATSSSRAWSRHDGGTVVPRIPTFFDLPQFSLCDRTFPVERDACRVPFLDELEHFIHHSLLLSAAGDTPLF